jgi:hypothetical protein
MIPRNSPEVVTHVNGDELTLTWYNSTLYFFDAYPEMNHIFVNLGKIGVNGEAMCTYIFNSPDQMKSLEKMKFPLHHSVEPDDQDVLYYIEWQSETLEREISQ